MKSPITWPDIPCDGDVGHAFPPTGERTTWKHIQEIRQNRWTKICEAYEANPGDFYAAWNWVKHHPVFFHLRGSSDGVIHERHLVTERGYEEGIEISVQRVNPDTKAIDHDRSLNVQTSVWVEIMVTQEINIGRTAPHWHDWELDTGADTFEQAIVVAAWGMYRRYGNDRKRMEELWQERNSKILGS